MVPKLCPDRIVVDTNGEIVAFEKGVFTCSPELQSEFVMNIIRRQEIQICPPHGKVYVCALDSPQGITATLISLNPPGARLVEGPPEAWKMWDETRHGIGCYVEGLE